MPYILPDDFLEKLNKIREHYEHRSNTRLDKKLQPCSVSIYFGAKDINARCQQIEFIQNCLLALKNDLKPDMVFASEEEIHQHLKALRIMIGVCLSVISEVDSSYTLRRSTNAILVQLIHEAMQLQGYNQLDKETRSLCLLEAQEFAKPYNTAVSVNRTFGSKFTESDWRDFKSFLKTECALLNEFVENYPITAIMMPFFSKQMELAGYSTGFVLGDMIGKSGKMVDTRYTLTATIAGGVYFVLRTSSALGGAMLVVPSLAGKLLDTYCGVSMAWILGSIMKTIGKGVGFGVGMTLDAGWKGLFHAISTIHGAFQNGYRIPGITGFTLLDPHRIVDGVELNLTENVTRSIVGFIDPPQQKDVIFEIQKEGILLQIGDETAIIPWSSTQIPDAQDLYQKLVEKKLLIEDKNDEMTACISLF